MSLRIIKALKVNAANKTLCSLDITLALFSDELLTLAKSLHPELVS
ncbi:MAG: hypothetical protein IJR35_10455 [Synergistaceae bacterium]|nr:hypothetical protein [Synergistaceae bacterium]MBQ9596265.1 hypothetical protein [Synergistaceae bacterium]MBR0202918.1 hypothetical protein [Synergistaceae bacterium]